MKSYKLVQQFHQKLDHSFTLIACLGHGLWNLIALQQTMGTFHVSISLNCHSSENDRRLFHMIMITHLHCPVTQYACSITHDDADIKTCDQH